MRFLALTGVLICVAALAWAVVWFYVKTHHSGSHTLPALHRKGVPTEEEEGTGDRFRSVPVSCGGNGRSKKRFHYTPYGAPRRL